MRRKIVVATVAGSAALAAGPAFAVWNASVTTTPTSAAAVALSAVQPPTTATATVLSSTSIAIRVTAAPTSGVIPTAYRIARGSTVVTGCDAIALNTDCTDSGLSAGTQYTYNIFGRVGANWIGSAALQLAPTTTAAPALQAITAGPTVNSGSPATWTVTFTQPVSGVTTSNFSIAGSGGATATVASTVPSGGAPSATWTVTSTNTTGSGSVRLDLANKTNVVDSGGTGLTTTTPFAGTSVTVNAVNKLHVSSITANSAIQNTNKYHSTLTVTVVDQNNSPVSGVAVTGVWNPTGPPVTNCGSTTNASGQCTITSGSSDFNTGTAETWTVSNLSLANYTYDSTADVKHSITINCSSAGTCTSS